MTKRDSKKNGPDLKKYKDDQSVSLTQMKIGLWLASNKVRIIRIITIFLIVVSLSLIGYSGYNYTIYFLYGRQADKALSDSLSENLFDIQAYREATAPQILLAGPVYSFSASGKKDFLVTVSNPNPNYYSVFDYCLRDGQGNDVVCSTDFVLPKSEKHLLIVAQDMAGTVNNLYFEAVNVFWQRLNLRQIPSWENYVKERLNMEIKDIVYKTPDYNSRTPLHNLSFTIENKTAYSFTRVPLNIVLQNNNIPVSLNIYNLDNFFSAEKRNIKISWPAGGERANQAEIFLNLNILDQSLYLPYRSNSLR
jgi:hypothetical protein